jgi:hypothetical protein
MAGTSAVFVLHSAGASVTFHRDGIVFALPDNDAMLKHQRERFRSGGGRKYSREPEASGVLLHRLTMRFEGLNPGCVLEGLDSLPSVLSMFHGGVADAPRLCPQFTRIRYRDIYPGIDLEYFGRDGLLTCAFAVEPGADASRIRIRYDSEDSTARAAAGDLFVQASATFQDAGACSAPSFERRGPLVIDPGYTVLYGGSLKEFLEDMTVGSDGRIYIVGRTLSQDLPVTDSAYQRDHRGDYDLFVSVFSPDGDSLLASTLIGTTALEIDSRIALDAQGNIVITANTFAVDYPVTADAVQPRQGGGACDGVISIFDPQCKRLLYSSYIGGSGYDQIFGLATDGDGNMYITGLTDARNFPVTAGAYQRTYGGGEDDVFIMKLEAGGRRVMYSTYVGGDRWDEGYAITLDRNRNATVCGFTRDDTYPTTPGVFQRVRPGWDDGFVTKINADGSELLYSTYLGADDNNDVCWDLVADDSGGVYIAGFTNSGNLPTTDGALQPRLSAANTRDCFLAHLDARGSTIIACTYFGRPGKAACIEPYDIKKFDSLICIVGIFTAGETFPVTTNGGSDSLRGVWDGFLSILDEDLSGLVYSGLIGGDRDDDCAAVCLFGRQIIVGGSTKSAGNFHKTNGLMRDTLGGIYDDVMLVFINVDKLLSVDHAPVPGSECMLLPAYPNPVIAGGGSSHIVIPFQLSRSAHAIIEIFDQVGRCVLRKDFGVIAPGPHTHAFSAMELHPGVHYCRLLVDGTWTLQRVVVIR